MPKKTDFSKKALKLFDALIDPEYADAFCLIKAQIGDREVECVAAYDDPNEPDDCDVTPVCLILSPEMREAIQLEPADDGDDDRYEREEDEPAERKAFRW